MFVAVQHRTSLCVGDKFLFLTPGVCNAEYFIIVSAAKLGRNAFHCGAAAPGNSYSTVIRNPNEHIYTGPTPKVCKSVPAHYERPCGAGHV